MLSWGDNDKGGDKYRSWVITTVTIQPGSVFYRSEGVVDMLLQEIFSILAPHKRLRGMSTKYLLPLRVGLSLRLEARYDKRSHSLWGEVHLFLSNKLLAIGEAHCNPYDDPLGQAQEASNWNY
jgi:hypothetical protein